VPGKSAAAVELERARQLESVRIRGVKGGVIAPHRSMVGLPWTIWRLFTTLILSLGGVAALLAALPYLGRFWQLVFERTRDFLGIHAPLGDQVLSLPGGLEFTLPVLAVATPQPDMLVLWIAGIVCAVVFVASFALPERFTPLRYFLRFLVVLQGSAILFFAVSRDPFPYRLQDHVYLLLTAGLVVMALVPLVLGFTLHLFDLAFWKKLLLTLALLIHFAVWLPLQALVHLWLILHGTALLMPVLFLMGGMLLDVLIFVAFYGWALSWRGELERRETMPPVHLGRKAGRRRERRRR
jgi:hypothetical protein